MKHTSLNVAIQVAFGCSMGLGAAAWSQEPGASAGLEEVIVTATRREVGVQDLPLAITALTAESMTMNNIEDMEDLKGVIPNVLVNGTLGGQTNAQFTMRGIPNVGTYVDGIWQVSSNGLLQKQFVALERVEVLRGPQGTLYGRDSTGGSIHLYTQRPADEFGAVVDLGVGSYDRQDVNASVDIPITENFRTRFTVGSFSSGGFLTSVTTGIKHGSFENDVVRADLNWTPSDRVDIRLIHQQDDIVQRQARIQNFIAHEAAYVQGFQVGVAEAIDIASGGLYNCLTQCSGFPGGALGEYETTTESQTPTRQKLEQTTLSVDVDLTDSIHFKYLYGDTFVDSRTYNDWDATQFNLFVNYWINGTDMDSHELQFSGGGDRISWVGGYYTWDQKFRQRNVEWASTDWSFFNAGSGQPQTLDYADVLASPACQRTPADVGQDFSFAGLDPNSPNGWFVPCGGGPFGLGWVGIFGVDAGDEIVQATQDGEAYFGEVTFAVTDRLDVTLGYRFHDQSAADAAVDLDAAIASGAAAPRPARIDSEIAPGRWAYGGSIDPSTVLAADFDESTYRFAATYQFTDGIMGFVGYSEGFNSGGVDSITDSLGRVVKTFPPEFIENTEIGIRSDLLGGRLRFNATYFDTNWKNIQLAGEVIDRGTGGAATELLTVSAASAVADGLELEFTYAATDRLIIDANLGFLNTKYTDSISPELPVNTEFSQAPDTTYNFGVTYDAGLSNGGSLLTRVTATHWDEYWRSQNPSFRQNRWVARSIGDEGGGITQLNARMAYRPPAGNYELALWGTNLLDEYNRNSGFMHGVWQFDFATLDRPREAGVSLRMFFD